MNRAEQKAVEYQIKTHGPNVIGGAALLSEEEYYIFNMNRDFKAGYEEAEKDLELTWKDIRRIRTIMSRLNAAMKGPEWDSKEYYEEVLRKFKEEIK